MKEIALDKCIFTGADPGKRKGGVEVAQSAK